jgi:hypothetical protein
MLTNVAVENDYLIDGEMKKIVSMDLTNHGFVFFIQQKVYKFSLLLLYPTNEKYFYVVIPLSVFFMDVALTS